MTNQTMRQMDAITDRAGDRARDGALGGGTSRQRGVARALRFRRPARSTSGRIA